MIKWIKEETDLCVIMMIVSITSLTMNLLSCRDDYQDPPINRITGERFQPSYIQEWRQALSTRHYADVPFSKQDRFIVGHWACDALGNLGMVYEYVGRDQEAKTVEFTGTKQSEGLRQRLDHIGEELQELMDYIEPMGK